ncbi:hypothetical protein LTR74_006702 [Friedmanniomyces endolithicus]|nr:hypothetical protein LTR74_006702 [Friedmanniomyces endolithicus]
MSRYYPPTRHNDRPALSHTLLDFLRQTRGSLLVGPPFLLHSRRSTILSRLGYIAARGREAASVVAKGCGGGRRGVAYGGGGVVEAECGVSASTDANPWFITGVPYTAEQRARDEGLGRFARDGPMSRLAVQVREEEACPGEDPEAQLLLLCDIVTPESYAELLRVSRTEEEWESGIVDDILLAVALHTSDEDLAARLGLAVDEIQGWLELAIDNFAAVHFLASDGRPRLAGGEERDALVARIRERHIDAASGEWMQLRCCRNGMLRTITAEATPTPV